MSAFSVVFMIQFILSSSQLFLNSPQLVFSIYRKDIHIVPIEKLKSTFNYSDTDILINTSGYTTYITEIDYNLRANILIWRKSEPENALFVAPINNSHSNLLGINKKIRLLKLNKSNSMRVSVDWIHNLVYYNENDKIIVLNMTHPHYGFILINNPNNLILDLSVNPLESFIFWSDFNINNNRGRIVRASQDGSNEAVLIDDGIREPTTLTIDLVLRKVFWIDRLMFKLSSIDFDGNHLQTVLQSNEIFTLSYFMDIFRDDIYWSNYFYHSILKTNKFGLNETQINYLMKSKSDYEIESIKIIDSSLQPNSTNKCIDANCSHLCIPISTNQYRCVCPHLRYNNYDKRQKCTESIHTISSVMTESGFLETTDQLSTTSSPTSTVSSLLTYTLVQLSEPDTTESSEESSMSATTEVSGTNETYLQAPVMRNDVTNVPNVSYLEKTLCIKTYQTFNMLYVLLVISIILNVLCGFGFLFRFYKKRKRQRNTRLGAQRILAEFKPIQFETIKNENNFLIQSNPLISNTAFLREDLNNDSFNA